MRPSDAGCQCCTQDICKATESNICVSYKICVKLVIHIVTKKQKLVKLVIHMVTIVTANVARKTYVHMSCVQH